MNQAFSPSGIATADLSKSTKLEVIGYAAFSTGGQGSASKLKTVKLPGGDNTGIEISK